VEPECRIRLEVFEGPLDLLLHLITRNRLSITDISISLVTNQYLEYLEFLKALDIEVAAEYLVMAATLMQIKSAMILPKPEPALETDPSAEDIISSLEELKRIKRLADLLENRPMLERDVFTPCWDMVMPLPPLEDGESSHPHKETFNVTILDLMDAFKKVMGRKDFPRTMEIFRAKINMEGRIEEIEQLLKEKKRLYFHELFQSTAPRHLLIATFLAILEIAKRGICRLIQESSSNRIMLTYRPFSSECS